MPYNAPREGEVIYAARTGVEMFTSASRNSPRALTNNEHSDHTLRGWEKGEEMGTIVSRDLITGADGNTFLRVRDFVWIWVPRNWIGLVGDNVKEWHESFLDIADEPFGWVRSDWQAANNETTEHDVKTAEIEAYIGKYPGIPKPISVYKRVETNGSVHWDITFSNNNTVDYEEFKDLTPAAKLTISSRDPQKPVALINSPVISPDKKPTSATVFTGQNVAILSGLLVVFGLLVFVLLRSNKPV